MLHIALLIVGCTTDTKTSVEDMVMLVDADGDGFISQEDCNDRDASIFPSAQEICDGVDNNCDDEIDEGVKTGLGKTSWFFEHIFLEYHGSSWYVSSLSNKRTCMLI